MPFVSNMGNPEEEEQKKQVAPQGGATPGGSGGSVRLAPGASAMGGGASSGGPAKTGGQFASLNQYLTANQGKAEPLAGKITADVGKQYQGLEAAGQQALQQIGSKVSANTGAENAQQTLAEQAANPVSFASDPGKVKSFQNLLTASYGGPQSAESTAEYAKQQADINKTIAEGQKSVQSEAGRQNLLAKTANRPTSGVTALNSAILSHSPEALAAVENSYKPFQGLLSGLDTGAAEANKTIAAQQEKAATARKEASEALKGQIGALNQDVTAKTAAAQKALADQNARIKSELAAGNVSDQSLQALGITRDQWNSLSAAQKAAATSQDVYSNQRQFGATTGTANINLGDFLTQQDPNQVINMANAATKEDYDKAQAFKTLMGNLNFGAPDLVLNPNAAAQAGKAPTDVTDFDYETALNTAKQAKADSIAAAQAYVDALQAGADEQHAQLKAQEAAKKSAAYGIGTATLGAWAPAGAGLGEGAVGGVKTAISKPTIKNVAQAVNTIAGPAAITNAAKGVAQGVTGAVKTVTNIFCFHPDTLVTMADGSVMPIHAIGVGDETKGGKVLATTRAIGQDFYYYNGVVVTGKHAVKEEGRWVRVENSKHGHRFKYLTEVVCNLVTEKHRIFAHGIEFADQYETDNYEYLNMDQSLEELNRNA